MSTAVYVRGFDFGTTAADIKKHMSKAGPVQDVELWGKGAAVVKYATPEKANAAVTKMNQTTIPGNSRYLDVKMDKLEGESGKRGPGGAGKVFVRGFDFGTTDEAFEAHMSQVGAVVKIQWCTKGSAIAHYGTKEEAEAAVATLNQTVMDGNSRYIDVILKEDDDDGRPPAKKAKKSGGKGNGDGVWMKVPSEMLAVFKGLKGKGGGQPKTKTKKPDPPGAGKVFVRGFDFDTQDEQLLGHMSAAGEVADVHWISKGSAVVVYKKKVGASKAVNTLNQTTIPGNSRYIDVILKDD